MCVTLRANTDMSSNPNRVRVVRRVLVDFADLDEQEAKESGELLRQAQIDRSMRRIDRAIENYQKDLELRYRSQRRQEMRVHKGAPYYNLGICHLYEERLDHNKAVCNLILAYVEDIISAKRYPDTAESLDAARLLRQVLQFDPRLMKATRTLIGGLENPQGVMDPNEILATIAEAEHIDRDQMGQLCKAKPYIKKKVMASINWPKRVFIGGNYSSNMAMLLKMKELVLERGLTPVVADDYDLGEQKARGFCLMLLHTCKFAVFDVTEAGGQFFEIERTRDYDIEPLLVFNADSLERKQPMTSGISMLHGLGFDLKPYRDPETDLEPLIDDYLTKSSRINDRNPGSSDASLTKAP